MNLEPVHEQDFMFGVFWFMLSCLGWVVIFTLVSLTLLSLYETVLGRVYPEPPSEVHILDDLLESCENEYCTICSRREHSSEPPKT